MLGKRLPQSQGDLISQYREMESSFYHYDGRTNTARLTDSAEVVTNEYVLDAWGGIVSESAFGSAADNEFLFMGQKQVQRDRAFGTKNPNYWARARQYDSKAGRFRSEDPIRDDESNLYRYAGNDPVNKVDPTGLQESCYGSCSDAAVQGAHDFIKQLQNDYPQQKSCQYQEPTYYERISLACKCAYQVGIKSASLIGSLFNRESLGNLLQGKLPWKLPSLDVKFDVLLDGITGLKDSLKEPCIKMLPGYGVFAPALCRFAEFQAELPRFA